MPGALLIMAYQREYEQYERLSFEIQTSKKDDMLVINKHGELTSSDMARINKWVTRANALIEGGKYEKAVKVIGNDMPIDDFDLLVESALPEHVNFVEKFNNIHRQVKQLNLKRMETSQNNSTVQKSNLLATVSRRFVVYYHDAKKGPRVAIACFIDDINRLYAGTALCSKQDKWDRKKGRKIAEGRLKKHPVLIGTFAEKLAPGPARSKLIKASIESYYQALAIKIRRRSEPLGQIISGRDDYKNKTKNDKSVLPTNLLGPVLKEEIPRSTQDSTPKSASDIPA